MAGETLIAAVGKWHGILTALGVDAALLTGGQKPCPGCGGRDRFRWDNKEGRGTWYCNRCGAGTGLTLLQLVHGWDARHAMLEVDRVVGTVKPRPVAAPDDARVMGWVRQIWGAATNERAGLAYLHRRGLALKRLPLSLRGSEALAYKRDTGGTEHYPGLVAAITPRSGEIIGVHRIYDADVADRKRTLGSMKGFVRLPGPDGALPNRVIVGEGLETTLAARELMWRCYQQGFSAESCLVADQLERWEPAPEHQIVLIFGDNDASYTGQWASYSLARRLQSRGIRAHVVIPPRVGWDWLDMLNAMRASGSWDIAAADEAWRRELTNDPEAQALTDQFQMRCCAMQMPTGWTGVFSRFLGDILT